MPFGDIETAAVITTCRSFLRLHSLDLPVSYSAPMRAFARRRVAQPPKRLASAPVLGAVRSPKTVAHFETSPRPMVQGRQLTPNRAVQVALLIQGATRRLTR